MKNIAIIGFGVVGGGITEVISQNAEKLAAAAGEAVNVKYILDLRDFPDSPYADRVVHSIEPILEDGDVSVVCETMGGSHPAFEYSISCMKAGKSVVTSNKEVVANFGDELLKCAAENGVSYMFEASVGGGIPVLRTINTAYAGDGITEISGILNGTTNYILTRMRTEGADFADALTEAQQLGYAERDPSADIDGIDAKRKIIILTASATGMLLRDEDVYAETLRNITIGDIRAAERWGGSVKLIAQAVINGDSIGAFVCPMFVPFTIPIAHISDVYNGISLKSPVTGDIMLCGRGAGRMPTAGAVMADVCAILSGAAESESIPVFEKGRGTVRRIDSMGFRCYIRASANLTELRDAVEVFGGEAELLSDNGGEVELITPHLTLSELESLKSRFDIISSIRVME